MENFPLSTWQTDDGRWQWFKWFVHTKVFVVTPFHRKESCDCHAFSRLRCYSTATANHFTWHLMNTKHNWNRVSSHRIVNRIAEEVCHDLEFMALCVQLTHQRKLLNEYCKRGIIIIGLGHAICRTQTHTSYCCQLNGNLVASVDEPKHADNFRFDQMINLINVSGEHSENINKYLISSR